MYFDDFIEFRPTVGHRPVHKPISRLFHPNSHGKVVNYIYYYSKTEYGIHIVLGNNKIKLG